MKIKTLVAGMIGFAIIAQLTGLHISIPIFITLALIASAIILGAVAFAVVADSAANNVLARVMSEPDYIDPAEEGEETWDTADVTSRAPTASSTAPE